MKIREILNLMEAIENRQSEVISNRIADKIEFLEKSGLATNVGESVATSRDRAAVVGKGASAIEQMLVSAMELYKKIPEINNGQTDLSNTETIDEGKFSSGLVAMAIAGLSALGSSGTAHAQNSMDIRKSLAFCAGVMIAASDEMIQVARRENNPRFMKTIAQASNYADRMTDVALSGISNDSSAAGILLQSFKNGKISQRNADTKTAVTAANVCITLLKKYE